MLLKFEVYKDGRWWGARAMGHAVFTQGKTLDELYRNIKEASHLHFEEQIQAGENIQTLIMADAEVRKRAPKAVAG